MKKLYYIVLSMIITAFLVFSCNESDDNGNSESIPELFDIESQIAHIFDYGIRPQIQTLKDQANDFKLLVTNYNQTPNEENFNALQDSWKQLVLSWKPLEVITIGDFALTSKIVAIHFWPIDSDLLNMNIQNFIEDDFVVGAKAKGLGALEYILFSNDYEGFSSIENTGNNLAYLEVLIDELIVDIELYDQEWLAYENEFKTSLETSVTGTQNKLVNEVIFTLYNILIDKIQGATLSNSEGLEVLNSETPYSEFSLASIQVQIEFMQKLFSGNFNDDTIDSISIYDQLNSLGRNDLVEALESQFQKVALNFASTNSTLENLILENSEILDQIDGDIRVLQVLISNDMVSALDILVTVSDNDGD